MLYCLILALLLLFSYHYDYRNNNKGKAECYTIVLCVLICVAGLRYRIGVDSIRYESIYPQFPTIFELYGYDFSSTRYGVGYIIFSSIARTISDQFVALQFLQAIFVNTTIFWFFKKYSSQPFFCVLIYYVALYFNFNCEVMREACAVCTLLLAWPAFIERRWLKYYLWAVVCCLFHTGGIIVLVLPIAYLPIMRDLFRIGPFTMLLLIGIYVVGAILSRKFFDYLQIIAIVDGIQEGIDMYSTSDLSGNTLNLGGIISTVIKYILFPFLGVWIMKHYKLSSLRINYNGAVFQSFEFMTVMCFIMAVLSIPITLFYRYTNYFFPFAIVMMSEWLFHKILYKKIKLSLTFGVYLTILFPFFLWQVYGLIKVNPEHHLREIYRYYPYSSRIDKSISQKRERLFNFYNAQ